MSFLNSIMLAGIAAVAVPIIIHLLNRRKFKTVTWAAMKFVKLSVDQNQRRMRIEDLILLLIRCALVILLALALARPASKDAASDVLGQTKVTAFVILDNSYSMDLQGRDGKNAFEEARAAAQETLKALPSGSAVGVLLASDIVQGLIDEPTYDLNQAEQAIKDAKVGHHATDLYPAVEFAFKALKPLQTAQPKEVYVITDGQASGWRQNSDIEKLIEDNKGDINFYVLRVGEDESPDNLAVTKMDISSGLTPINHPLRFDVEVANHGMKERQDVTVDLFVNDEASPRDQVSIPSVPPGGTASVPLFTRLDREGYYAIRAAFKDPKQVDALAADNENHLVVRAVKDLRVLLVDGHQQGTDIRDHESFFLQVALSPVADHYVQVDVKSPGELSRTGLERYAAVIMANVPSFEENDIELMQNYLRNGGGMIFYPGDKVDRDYYNEELFSKHAILPSPWGVPTGDASQDEQYVEFQKRAFEHPVTSPWNNPEFGSLGSARTFRWHPLEEKVEEQSKVKESGLPRVVLRYEKKAAAGQEEGILGGPAIMERDWGGGKVYQFSSTADTDWSDLPIRGASVVPLVYRIIGSIQANQDSGLNLRVGEPFRKTLAVHQSSAEGFVFDPGLSRTNNLTAQTINEQPVLEFKDTHRAGFYDFQLKGDSVNRVRFAVQPDQRESDLRKIDDGDLPAGADLIRWDSNIDFKAAVQKKRIGAELWLWVFGIVLFLAGLETFLAQKFSQSK